MKKSLFAILAAALASACATTTPQPEACCNAKEIVYIDKAVSECTRAVQRITQVSPCETCSYFQLSARAGSSCAQ